MDARLSGESWAAVHTLEQSSSLMPVLQKHDDRVPPEAYASQALIRMT